jgi:hypothetical protein
VGFRCGGLKEDLAAGFFYFDFSKGEEERRGEERRGVYRNNNSKIWK